MSKTILNITDAPLYSKALPFASAALGVGIAKMQGKECVWCYVGYGLTGLILGAIPLYFASKQK